MRDRDDTLTFLKERVASHDSYIEDLPNVYRLTRVVLGGIITAILSSGGSVVLSTVRNNEQIDELRRDIKDHTMEDSHTVAPELRQEMEELRARYQERSQELETARANMTKLEGRIYKLERKSRHK